MSQQGQKPSTLNAKEKFCSVMTRWTPCILEWGRRPLCDPLPTHLCPGLGLAFCVGVCRGNNPQWDVQSDRRRGSVAAQLPLICFSYRTSGPEWAAAFGARQELGWLCLKKEIKILKMFPDIFYFSLQQSFNSPLKHFLEMLLERVSVWIQAQDSPFSLVFR